MRILTLLILLILSGVLFYQWHDYDPEARGLLDQAVAAADQGVEDGFQPDDFAIDSLPGLQQYEGIVERTIFNKARTFDLDNEEVVETPTVQLKQDIKVQAILYLSDEYVALVDDGSGKLKRVKKGDIHQGWTIDWITSDKLVLTSGDTVSEVPLRVYPEFKYQPQRTKKPTRQATRENPFQQVKPKRTDRKPVTNRTQPNR